MSRRRGCSGNVNGSAGFAQAGVMLNSTPITQRVLVALDRSLALATVQLAMSARCCQRRHPRKPVTQYSEASMMELKGCGILDVPHARGMTGFFGTTLRYFVMRKMPRKTQHIREGKCQDKAVTMANFRHTITAKLGDPT
jgi:hypothetical protein